MLVCIVLIFCMNFYFKMFFDFLFLIFYKDCDCLYINLIGGVVCVFNIFLVVFMFNMRFVFYMIFFVVMLLL